ncbi:hypothetical protein EJ03DRAFT_353281 [Teratosphaeria nubilosa]|uniref:Uncharacterized protein n=1 Tax=Teratosphaeria nubilosa TaxID=161662 RepID=A0A6G1L3G6_9PEZI|nr:hypothetical protein EJ03DRAFT_353281 [Teratosphaeria nubilosa]
MANSTQAPDNRTTTNVPPLFSSFQRICFTRPGFRDQTRNEDKGDWYTNIELELMLSGLYAKRMLFHEKIISQACSNNNCCRFNHEGQPFENAIIVMITYLSNLQQKKVTFPWNPEHFVEEAGVLVAYKTLFKKEMTYDIVRERQPIAAQADPKSGSRVHYLSRDAARLGFDEYVGGGISVHHLYQLD